MEDGDTHPYCLMKDFYTHTDGEHECDEKTYRGDFYYTPYEEEDEEPKFEKKHTKKKWK